MIGAPSQKFVPIQNIRDGIVMLDDGSLRLLIEADSINLALKSEEEQSAIYTQFQNLLNTIDFPIQIYCQSRRVNMDNYLQILSDRAIATDNELLKLQIIEYIEYIKAFTSETNIMKKRFIVVIPYTPAIITNKDDLVSFTKNKSQIEERASVVLSGLGRCGIKTKILDTEEIIETYYKLFNPTAESKVIG